MSKTFEHTMKDKLSSFFEKHKIFSSAQYGFHKFISVQAAVNKITDILEYKSFAMVHLIGFSKAFGSISSDLLLKKLQHYGVRGGSLINGCINMIFKNIETDVINVKKINGKFSDFINVTSALRAIYFYCYVE